MSSKTGERGEEGEDYAQRAVCRYDATDSPMWLEAPLWRFWVEARFDATPGGSGSE